MDIKRSINTKVWNDPWFEELSSEEKLIWIYLLSNQYSNLLGIYEISIRRISYDTNTTPETIRKAFEGFERVRKAFHINGYIVIVNWLKNQNMNTNMQKCVKSLFNTLPADLIKAIESHGFSLILSNDLNTSESNKLFANGFNLFRDNLNPSEPFGTISEPFERVRPIEIEIEKEIEKEKEIEIEIENDSPFDFFLKQNEIFNKVNSEFLGSEEWFNVKAMQLHTNPQHITVSAKEFILDLRDRDLLVGKDLVNLRSHFISWFKKRPVKQMNGSASKYVPDVNNR